MAKAPKKSKKIDNPLTHLFGIDRVKIIKKDVCVMCAKPATEFRDDVSKKEYVISGLCQRCQDEIFGS